MIVKKTSPYTIQKETFDDIISETSCLHIVDETNTEYAFTPNFDLEDSKVIKESVKQNLIKYNIPTFVVTKGGGVTIHGDGDFAYSLIVPSGVLSARQVCEFLRDYISSLGYNSVALDNNDILIDSKKVAGIAFVDHHKFKMVNIMGMVTLTDHKDLFDKIFGELYDEPDYKMPSYVPLNKENLISAFTDFLKGVFHEL